MADLLRTDYKDDVLNTEVNTQRKYQMITNDDGTVSFVDVTDYAQVGDNFGAADINKTNLAIDELNNTLGERRVKTYTTFEQLGITDTGVLTTWANVVPASSIFSFYVSNTLKAVLHKNGLLPEAVNGTVTIENIGARLDAKFTTANSVYKGYSQDGRTTNITWKKVSNEDIQTQLNNKVGLGSSPFLGSIFLGDSTSVVPYIYSQDGNINFRFVNSKGSEGWANMRSFITPTLSGTTLYLNTQ